jgi:hypothetical protein
MSIKWRILNDATVFGCKYFSLEPSWDKWGNRKEEWDNWVRWCVLTYGGTGDLFTQEPVAKWYANSGRLWFRNEEDVTMFLLKWS